MANIRVTCPSCQSELEIDSAYEGQEIECGGCLQVFAAKANKPDPDAAGRSGSGGKGRGSASDGGQGRSARGSRRRDDDDRDDDRDRKRRNDDDDDDDDDDYPPRERSRSQQNGVAITSLVLGIASVVLVLIMLPMACIGGCCCPPLAWLPLPITIPTSLGAIITGVVGVRKPEGKAMAITGIVLGVIALTIAILQMAFGFLPFLAAPPAPVR